MAAINGGTRSLTNAGMTGPKAMPITTPTARSTTVPRSRKALNPCISLFSLRNRQHHFSELLGRVEPRQSLFYFHQRIDAVNHRPQSTVDRIQHSLKLGGVAHRRAQD